MQIGSYKPELLRNGRPVVVGYNEFFLPILMRNFPENGNRRLGGDVVFDEDFLS